MFSPLAFPTGMILYDLSFSVPPTSHLELFPFEIYREPLVVIAIADGTELSKRPKSSESDSGINRSDERPEGLDELLEEMDVVRERNPRALVHQLLIFDFEGQTNISNGPEDVLWVPPPQASKATTMKTVLCDITSLLLSELDDFAKTMQSIPSIESPKASSWGPHRGPELRPRPTDRLMHRMTLPSQFPSNPDSAPETPLSSNQSSPVPSDHETPTTFDEITRSIQISSRSNSIGRFNSLSSTKEHNRDRISVSGMSATDRTKNRIKGRVGVVIGTLYLQAGRWPDALKELVEAASSARASSDYVWHAKALESILLCLVMFGWAGMDFQIPPICYPVADKSAKSLISSGFDSSHGPSTPGNRVISLQNLSNLLPDLSNNIINLYNRAANITDEPLPQLVFSETVIRLSRLLVAARIRDGTLDDNALKHIVMNEPLSPLHQPERPRGTVLLRKSDIANFLFRALPLSPGSDLPATDAIPIIVGVISVLHILDLPRKKAFVLRELLSTMVPTLVQARKIGAAEVGIHPAAGLSSLSDAAFEINALDLGPGNMEASLRMLLAAIGEIYGVQPSGFYEWEKRREKRRSSRASGSDSYPEYDSVAAIMERAFRHAALDGYGDLNLKIDVLKACINCCEALPDFEGVLRFTVELLQTIRGSLMLADAYHAPPYLPPEEQVRLLNNIKRTVGAANRLGAAGLEAEYWDDFLVRGVQLLPLPDPRRPVRRSKSEMDAVTTHSEKSKKDPFLYNPFSRANKASELLMVAGEHAAFKVTFQNPYEFELEIESVRLDNEGVKFDAVAEWILLPPLSLQDIVVYGLAHEKGPLNVTGCIVKVRHCRERKFPIFTNFWKPESETKFKRTGLAAKKPTMERPLSWSSTTSRDGKQVPKKGPETTSCEVKVIGHQPSLIIDSMSLSQSAMMVLEGEVRSFDITLHNTSPCALDFITFTFQDSTSRQVQTALGNRDLLATEVYELELKLSTKPALRWRRKGGPADDLSISASQSATFTVDILGKPGLQDTTVQIDYSRIGRSDGELPDVLYTRQLFVPLTVTVNASIEVARCDVLPFSSDFAWWNKQDPEIQSENTSNEVMLSSSDNDPFSTVLSQLGRGAYGPDHCLLLLDLRNAWPSTLSVSLYVSEQPMQATEGRPAEAGVEGQYAVHGDLQPGQITRFVLVVPRLYLDNPYATIPLLNTGMKRQFVVSANKLTFEAEAATREAFWYREELLKRVCGFWKEEPARREGTIDLRNLRLNARMVEAMRLEDVDMTFSLAPSFPASCEKGIIQSGRSKYNIRTDEMLDLSVTIHNRSSKPIHPLLRLQPSLRHQPNSVALDLSRRLVWTGMLQQVLPILGSGESTTATIGVAVLCRGEYELGATIEEVRVLKTKEEEEKTGQGVFHDSEGAIRDTFGADVAKKRRIWHAKECCVLDAYG